MRAHSRHYALLASLLLAVTAAAADADPGTIFFTEDGLFDHIYRMDADGGSAQSIHSHGSRLYWGMDVDPVGGELYFIERLHNKIHCIQQDGTGLDVAIQTPTPADVSIDPIGGRMYYSANTDLSISSIRSANLDGTDEQILAYTDNTGDGVAVDYIHEKLYWVESGSFKRSNLDGTNIEFLYSRDHWWGGVTLDLIHDKVFWTEDEHVVRSNLNGSNREFFYVGEFIPTLRDLTYDYLNDKIIWTYGGGIQRGTFGDPNSIEQLYTGSETIAGITFLPEPSAAILLLAGIALITAGRR